MHIVTVNDYLARRDSEWVGQVHRFLGLGVGLIQMNMQPAERRAAYENDVTYVTNSELGFDYLRDNLASVSILFPGGIKRYWCCICLLHTSCCGQCNSWLSFVMLHLSERSIAVPPFFSHI